MKPVSVRVQAGNRRHCQMIQLKKCPRKDHDQRRGQGKRVKHGKVRHQRPAGMAGGYRPGHPQRPVGGLNVRKRPSFRGCKSRWGAVP